MMNQRVGFTVFVEKRRRREEGGGRLYDFIRSQSPENLADENLTGGVTMKTLR